MKNVDGNGDKVSIVEDREARKKQPQVPEMPAKSAMPFAKPGILFPTLGLSRRLASVDHVDVP